MNTIFMNSKNSKTPNLKRLSLNLTAKVNLKWSDKYVALSNLSMHYTWKNIKKLDKNNNLNVSSNMEWITLIIWWIIFFIRYSRLFWIYLKKTWRKTVNPSIRIYVNKIENINHIWN